MPSGYQRGVAAPPNSRRGAGGGGGNEAAGHGAAGAAAAAAAAQQKYVPGIDPAIAGPQDGGRGDSRGMNMMRAMPPQAQGQHPMHNQPMMGPGPGQMPQGQMGQQPPHYANNPYMAPDPRQMIPVGYHQVPGAGGPGLDGRHAGGELDMGPNAHMTPYGHQHQHQHQHGQNPAATAAAVAAGGPGPGQGVGAVFKTEPGRPTDGGAKGRRQRLGWSAEETADLMEGCKRHGVGNWKKILTDETLSFNHRTAVDLKDRFRTSFPEEYARLYPNAKTHKMRRRTENGAGAGAGAGTMVMHAATGWNDAMGGGTTGLSRAGSVGSPGSGGANLVKINRKERRAFSKQEDANLFLGFQRHGPAWSKIQRDPTLNFQERRSTDLRDRFRNAFPDEYARAGYKGRVRRRSGSGSSLQPNAPPQGTGSNSPSVGNVPTTTDPNLMMKDDPSDPQNMNPYSAAAAAAAAAQAYGHPYQNMYYPQQGQGEMMFRQGH